MNGNTKGKMTNNIWKAAGLGQSIWCDYISKSMIENGGLEKLLEEGVRGVTTNPTIFQKAIAQSTDYDRQIGLLAKLGATDQTIYDELTIADVGAAADLLLPVWQATGGLDGYVSLEVSPLIAEDTQSTVDEAIRLWEMLSRVNVMIKIPATKEGILAIEKATSLGINVNVTLIFSLKQYEDVARAYISGLEKFIKDGGEPKRLSSVASVFVSRVDTVVDGKLKELGNTQLQGKIAIDNAKQIYQKFLQAFGSSDFAKLAALGAKVQRPLWASTGTKNKDYSPTIYVDQLIGRDTVNTVPPATLEAFLESGTVEDVITADLDGMEARLAEIANMGIDLDEINGKLLEDGVKSFADSFRELMDGIASKRQALAE